MEIPNQRINMEILSTDLHRILRIAEPSWLQSRKTVAMMIIIRHPSFTTTHVSQLPFRCVISLHWQLTSILKML